VEARAVAGEAGEVAGEAGEAADGVTAVGCVGAADGVASPHAAHRHATSRQLTSTRDFAPTL
jgi:hypothetical protein